MRLPMLTGNTAIHSARTLAAITTRQRHGRVDGCAQSLYLNHAKPAWWQWVTHAVCHGSYGHLSGNLFNLYVFGRLVEETEGAFGVWFTFIVTAAGTPDFRLLLHCSRSLNECNTRHWRYAGFMHCCLPHSSQSRMHVEFDLHLSITNSKP